MTAGVFDALDCHSIMNGKTNANHVTIVLNLLNMLLNALKQNFVFFIENTLSCTRISDWPNTCFFDAKMQFQNKSVFLKQSANSTK